MHSVSEPQPRIHTERVRRQLIAQGRKQTWLAQRLGVSPGQLCRLLDGDRRLQPGQAVQIADALGLPLDYVLQPQEPEAVPA